MAGTIRGKLTPSNAGTISARLSSPEKSLGLKISGSQIDMAERYEGDYEVTPRAEPQTLATARKKMISDLTIEGVPLEQVTNSGGGYTVTIL